MVQRYVFIKLDDAHATDTGRSEVAARARETLARVDGVTAVTVGVPADEPAVKSWDVGIVLRFANLDDVERYRENPDHRAFVDEFLRPRMAVIKAWNFTVTGADT